MLIKDLRSDGSFSSVEINEQEEDELLKLVVRYIINNCVLEETEEGHYLDLHYIPDYVFKGEIQ